MLIPLFLAACAGVDARNQLSDRAAQAPLILEAVLRYEIQQFAPKSGEPMGVVCLAVRHDGGLVDPSASMLKRIDSARSQPQSVCKGSRTLTAGPIEWRLDDEVRVSGGYVRPGEGETRLAYRVVFEEGFWRCVGPVIERDPL